MFINYDKSRLKSALEDFFYATGITLQLLDENFVTVHTGFQKSKCCMEIQSTKTGISACRCSDVNLLKKCKESMKPEIHTCHAGLSDIAVPLVFDDNIAGYIIMGQIKTEENSELFLKNIQKLPVDFEKMQKYYNETPVFDMQKVESVARLAEMLAKYILTEDILKPSLNRNADVAAKYINNNLFEKLSADSISRNANMSKSTLYKCFHDCFNCTVNEYISKKRIERAMNMLLTTDYTIEEISQRTGFSNAAYFTKIFKKMNGKTPLKYKKEAVR